MGTGVVACGQISDVPVEVFDGVVATNLLGPVNLARRVQLRLRRARRGGHFGPLFAVAAQDQLAPVVRGPGNVLESQQEGNRLRGHQGSALLGVVVNVVELTRRRVRRGRGRPSVGGSRS